MGIGTYAFRAVRKQATVNRTALKNKDTTKMFASYTSLEKKLLFPILGVVWISVKLYQKYLGYKDISSKQTKITPTETKDDTDTETENMETHETDEKDTDLTKITKTETMDDMDTETENMETDEIDDK